MTSAHIKPLGGGNMNIQSPAEDKIIVDLTEQDMLELEITYEDMDYSTIETRRVIWTVLDEAGKALGREFDPSRRMIIEATPKSEGGCILSFTILDSRRKYLPQKQLLKKQHRNLICEFENTDLLYKAVESLKTAGCAESSLYESGGRYRLIISDAADPAQLKNRLCEFGKTKSADSLACCFTKEHWHELIAENAIDRLLS